MWKSVHAEDLSAVLTELHILCDHAHARAELKTPDDDFLPDYWYGVAKGYENAIERIERLVQNCPSGN